MAKTKTLGFWENFEFFFLSDDDARWKAIGWIIAVVGCLGSLEFVVLSSNVDDVILTMGGIGMLMFIAWITLYCSAPRTKKNAVPTLLSRRGFVFQTSAILAAALMGIGIRRVQAEIVDRELEDASLFPTKQESINDVTAVLQKAKATQVRISADTTKRAGTRFAEASLSAPDAWPATQALLNYKSSLNTSHPNPRPQVRLPFRTFAYYTWFTAVPSTGVTYALGLSNPPDVAEVHPLDKPDVNVNQIPRATFFLITVARLKLDGMFMKNVIIKDSQVDYYGGEMVLRNVYFVNCTFSINLSQNGVQLAKGMFNAEPSITLQIPSSAPA